MIYSDPNVLLEKKVLRQKQYSLPDYQQKRKDMSQYEIIVLGDGPEANQAKPVAEVVEATVAKFKGKVVAKDEWGERPMAYRIKGRDRGEYTVFTVEMGEKVTKKVATALRLEKNIIRVLIIKKA